MGNNSFSKLAAVAITAGFVISPLATAEDMHADIAIEAMGQSDISNDSAQSAPAQSFHDFEIAGIDMAPMDLSQYTGNVVMLVNTASFCGFTPQYKSLQVLWEEKKDDGLVILGVPANDFGSQEPGSEETIKRFCEINYQVDFPMTKKMIVNGKEGTAPLYEWLAAELGDQSRPKWNFHKYIIGKNGDAVAFFESKVTPDDATLLSVINTELEK